MSKLNKRTKKKFPDPPYPLPEKRVMTAVGPPRRLPQASCQGRCRTKRGRQTTPHRMQDMTFNGVPGWVEMRCLICRQYSYWHLASNYEFLAHTGTGTGEIVGRREPWRPLLAPGSETLQ